MILAEKHAAWSDIARKIAHEVKNPLTPIKLSAERIERKFNNKDENFHSIENGFGKFSRSFQLPDEINEEKITASHKNGMLHVSVMKDPKASLKKTIQIK